MWFSVRSRVVKARVADECAQNGETYVEVLNMKNYSVSSCLGNSHASEG